MFQLVKILTLVVVLLIGIWPLESTAALATCTATYNNTHVQLPSEIKVTDNTGNIIELTNWIEVGQQTVYDCQYNGEAFNAREIFLSRVPIGKYNGSDIYPTTLDGIGFLAQARGVTGTGPIGNWYDFPWQGLWNSYGGYTGDRTFQFDIRIKLLKYNKIRGDAILPRVDAGQLGVFQFYNESNYLAPPFIFGINGGTRIYRDQACTVDTRNINVPMDQVSNTTLSGNGARGPFNSTSVDIRLSCPYQGEAVKMRFDYGSEGGRGTYLNTVDSSGNIINGLGIELMYEDEYRQLWPVRFGQEIFYLTAAQNYGAISKNKFFIPRLINYGTGTPPAGSYSSSTVFSILYP
ncbi:fimbrial protein [Shewanella gaetbuli]|uniref:Fimbrial protein n=1 Tax=Shewanella gaetbuli TaxID=220752 RepID=A0A9X2CM70_9GAMM|nr:fimbrial protein [Shewanella gaetbuli]MCL1143375.1 fimbrial protein [Shewanella gaetbuli]